MFDDVETWGLLKFFMEIERVIQEIYFVRFIQKAYEQNINSTFALAWYRQSTKTLWIMEMFATLGIPKKNYSTLPNFIIISHTKAPDSE